MNSAINDLFRSISPDVQGLNTYRYQRNVSGGIQEYMEAVLFQHYLETQQVMSHDQAARLFPADVMLTYEDYALGLFDMTGELMRFAITYMATNGSLPGLNDKGSSSSNILTDMQDMRSQLEILDISGSYTLSKDFEQKMKTTKNSVEKVENSVYSMIVRGSERPKGWRPDLFAREEPSEQVESY
jgi:predicted translin family RNA/ssDNA-binding protein